MSNILIEANNISKIYDQDIFLKKGTNFRALNMVDFTLKEQDFIAIMGPSGSGKSTLLNCLSTLDQVTLGTVKVLGDLVNDLNDVKLSKFRYKYLGFVFQNHNLISTLSIFDNIAAPIMLADMPIPQIIEKVNNVAKRLNIQHILNKKPAECSGGEKQRVAIARAIINNPKIIICDEPTGNLDSKNSHQVLSLLCKLNQEGASIILVTHDSMIASYAKTLIYLRDGNIKTILKRNNSSQVDFFDEINKITRQDSLLKIFDNEQIVSTNDISTVNKSNIEKEEVDHSNKKTRETVYAVFQGRKLSVEAKKNRLFYIYDNRFEYDNIFHEHVVININDIEEIVLSYTSDFKLLGIFSEYVYYTTADIKTVNELFQFKFENIDDLSPLFTKLTQAGVKIIDPIGIQQIYQDYPEYLLRHRFIQRNYRRFKKDYGAK